MPKIKLAILRNHTRSLIVLIARSVIWLVFFAWETCGDMVDSINARFTGLLVEPEYVRTGQCKMTGQCCKAIGIEFPKSWTAYPAVVNMLARWHSLRYNFTNLGQADNMLVYECRYLQANNRCGIQRFKPKLCREFPAKPWRGKIRLHKGCGYQYTRTQSKPVVIHKKSPGSTAR